MKLVCAIAIAVFLLPHSALAQSKTESSMGTEIQVAQCGWWTHCWGGVDSSRMYIAESAQNIDQCKAILDKCAGISVNANFSTNATLQPCNVTVTRC